TRAEFAVSLPSPDRAMAKKQQTPRGWQWCGPVPRRRHPDAGARKRGAPVALCYDKMTGVH
ncbi:hypothetical protein, partial [Streptomyces otsuchiensis]|uniref:hypothetical protein n=1 Tax=Streptomyces otsuchiensis TaxID=2681388 RepID=UPI001D132086